MFMKGDNFSIFPLVGEDTGVNRHFRSSTSLEEILSRLVAFDLLRLDK